MTTPLVIPVPDNEARRELARLVSAYEDDRLTAGLLSEAVATINEDTGRSVGFEFIEKNPQALACTVHADDRLDFWSDLVGIPDIVRLFSNYTLLRQLRPDLATVLMREAFRRHPMPECSWIRTARNAGVDIQDIKDVILAQLKDRAQFDNAAVREFARSLVLTGAGEVREAPLYWIEGSHRQPLQANDIQSVWWALRYGHKHDWLFDILMQCAERCPQAFFAPRDERTGCSILETLTSLTPEVGLVGALRRPDPYFTVKKAIELIRTAASHLTSFTDVCDDALDELPVGSRRELAERALPGSLAFVVRTAIKDVTVRPDSFHLIVACMPTDGLEALEIYRDLYEDLHGVYAKDNAFVQGVVRLFHEALRYMGYPVGVLQYEQTPRYGLSRFIRVTDPTTKGSVRYVRRDRPAQGHASKLYPKGTLVFVDTRQACNQPTRPDAHTVMVIFTAVSRDMERTTR